MENIPIFDCQIEKILRYELLTVNEVELLCEKAQELFIKEPNVVCVHAPVTVCGDTHGQFPDLVEVFKIAGMCPNINILLLGDYVDRGFYSVENVSCLIALKVRFPDRVTLLRGNHESKQITQVYGFYDECLRKYGDTKVWNLFTKLFDNLPIGALIENEILCLHGGLSPTINRITEIESLNRFEEIPSDGPLCDLMWSDPDEKDGWGMSPREFSTKQIVICDLYFFVWPFYLLKIGAGHIFGKDITAKFNRKNQISLIARAHQLIMDGYNLTHNESLVTLFTAPNYCMRSGNKGALMQVDDKLNHTFIQFEMSKENNNKIVYDRPPDFLF
ncbi:serine/threonine-protein phosphatase pp2a-related [Anaeramoeba flamelloides]|uniref:Serine/threonine-protein phosphatase n=1 Tax=Anaeramoeba flamelloides TaxID=1746091 RepID=A0AAV8A6D9_9EUKA|nr:serine/threonine-protein phosphatase pp2a-related [Anaeramoeba flamelloides]